ncbi:uncharacterized protein LOC112270036 [Brachypodium distachyon]|uniref:uncharacterized protein LOC112270036 n=1 Tax=Brachypodium distachyon TaxID=15368 RepID=UPI00052FE723|nr:uncharacterized protein LOC112270036 [Brachypodium distachyon]|eukprot:XP_024313446.1 uncharacterized protein LOC112270036 [Brachypodium distachyon]
MDVIYFPVASYTFRIFLKPCDNFVAKFAITRRTLNEVDNRLKAIVSGGDFEGGVLDASIADGLKCMLDDCNPLVQKFRAARDRLAEHGDERVGIRIIDFQLGILHNGIEDSCDEGRTMVDGFACVEEGRLNYIAEHQEDFRCDHLQGVTDAASAGQTDGSSVALESVEFRKRGLPHAHMLVWLDGKSVEGVTNLADHHISAEIPDIAVDPLGYALVAEFMMHGCVQFDNRLVVPYNMTLLKRYQAHINVEWCTRSEVLKYLFKYVTKGTDRANVVFRRHRPPVERLACHLPNMNTVLFKPTTNLTSMVSTSYFQQTTLTGWFAANSVHVEAMDLTYRDFPTKWRCVSSSRALEKRKSSDSIGRMYYVPPSAGECYYLRMLLMYVKGAHSYDDVRTFDGVVHDTFKEACAARGLLGDDEEWRKSFDEAVSWGMGYQLRALFVLMFIYCGIGDERAFFDRYWRVMSDDILYGTRRNLNNPLYIVPDETLINLLLKELHDLFGKNGVSASNYNLPAMTSENGGTGKTFLWNVVVSHLRSQHVDETTVCDIKRDTMLAGLIKSDVLIIWDEALMTHRRCFEALDRSLRDVLSEEDPTMSANPFGGKVVVLGGDLRQILPVVEGGLRSKIVNDAITSSPLWHHAKVLELRTNMRLRASSNDPASQAELAEFSAWVLAIGDDVVYVDFLASFDDASYLCARAILAPINEVAFLKEFQVFNDKASAIIRVCSKLAKMIKRSIWPGQKLAVGKCEYKNIIEASLGIPCLFNEAVLEVMWGLKYLIKVLVPGEEVELTNEDRFQMCQGLKLVHNLYGFEVESKMVNSDIIGMACIVYESGRCVDKRASYLDHGRAKLSEVSTIDSTNWDELKLATPLKLICYPEEQVETGDSGGKL